MALLFSDPIGEMDRIARNLWRPSAMAMDVYRKDDALLVQLDVPGATRDDIELTVEKGILTISVTRTAPTTAEGVTRVLGERPQGTLRRQLALGDQFDGENIVADLAAGVLTLSIPVAAHAQPRRIPIAVREASAEALASA